MRCNAEVPCGAVRCGASAAAECLHEHELGAQLGLPLQKHLKGEQPQRSALEPLHLVDAQDELLALVAPAQVALRREGAGGLARAHDLVPPLPAGGERAEAGALRLKQHRGLDAHVAHLHHDVALVVAHADVAARLELVVEAEQSLAAVQYILHGASRGELRGALRGVLHSLAPAAACSFPRRGSDG